MRRLTHLKNSTEMSLPLNLSSVMALLGAYGSRIKWLPFLGCVSFALIHAPLLQSQTVKHLEVGSNFEAVAALERAATPLTPQRRYIVKAGIHRGQSLRAIAGDIIEGENGAIISGAMLLGQWSQENGKWVNADITKPIIPYINDPSLPHYRTNSPQELYLDDVRLKRVSTLAALVSEDQWYYDITGAGKKLHVLFNPAGRKVELTGLMSYAFDGNSAERVTIRNLIVEKIATPVQGAAIIIGKDGLCERCEIRWCYSSGLNVRENAVAQENYIHHNIQTGLVSNGGGTVIQRNEIAYNADYPFRDIAWEMGGVKVANTVGGITFRHNYIHRNYGPGIWTDVDSENVVISENVIENNDWEGVLIELSWSARINNNIIRGNGQNFRGQNEGSFWGSQVLIQNSSGSTIENNYLESPIGLPGKKTGVIAVNQDDRGGGRYGLHSVKGIVVRNNTFIHPEGGHNGVDYGLLGWQTYQEFKNSNINWHDNTYYHGGEPLTWSWRYDVTPWKVPEYYLATRVPWATWSQEQDFRSVIHTRPLGFFNHANPDIDRLITERTGISYSAIRAGATRITIPDYEADTDKDGMPDQWELARQLNPFINDAAEDPDQDGLSNLREYELKLNPRSNDTDGDAMPDNWELQAGLDPGRYESFADPDNDGLTNLEEYQEGTRPLVSDPLYVPIPASSFSLWCQPDSGIRVDDTGNLARWEERGPHKQLITLSQSTTRFHEQKSPSGKPLLSAPTGMTVPEIPSMWGTQDQGFTMSFVFRPRNIVGGSAWYAVFSTGVYQQNGFRIYMQGGRLFWSSSQGGVWPTAEGRSALSLNTTSLLFDDTVYRVTLVYGGKTGKSSLYLDGVLQSSSEGGFIYPPTGVSLIGATVGVQPQPAEWGDVIVINRPLLSHRERFTIERCLFTKYVLGYTTNVDTDQDGMPDEWEIMSQLDFQSSNAADDPDGDGLANIDEFARKTHPQYYDSDGDGLPDGWEVAQQTDPLAADSVEDPDQDGYTNFEEYSDGTSPFVPDPRFVALPKNVLAFWAQPGLDVRVSSSGRILNWFDQSASRYSIDIAGDSYLPGGHVSTSGQVLLASPPEHKALPSVQSWGNDDGGFNLIFAYRPISFPEGSNISSVITNESSSPKGGFRLYLRGKRLLWSSLQNDGTLSIESNVSLQENKEYIINLRYGGSASYASIYIDGKEVARQDNAIIKASLSGWLRFGAINGVASNAAAWGDAILFSRPLSFREKGTVEQALLAKYNQGFADGIDSDGDGMPDLWEIYHGLDFQTNDSALDPDLDGLPNLEEFLHKTHPLHRDTDGDGLPDKWEIENQTAVTTVDGHLDPDGDGLTTIEEYEEGSHPLRADPMHVLLPSAHLSIWAQTNVGIQTDNVGNVTEWKDQSPAARVLSFRQPYNISSNMQSLTGLPLINSEAGFRLPARSSLWGADAAESGFTFTFAYQPRDIVTSNGQWFAILSNESYLNSGFRVFLQTGRVVWTSSQGGGNFSLSAFSALTNGQTHVITLSYGGQSNDSSLFIDGVEQSRTATGNIIPSEVEFAFGYTNGAQSQAGAFGDMLLYNRRLGHRERRTVEAHLRGKFITGEAISLNHMATSDIPSSWSSAHGLSGEQALATADPDGDGWDNLWEYLLGLHPMQPSRTSVPQLIALPNGGMRLVLTINPNETGWDVITERSLDMNHWEPVELSVSRESSTERSLTVPPGNQAGFYRLTRKPKVERSNRNSEG